MRAYKYWYCQQKLSKSKINRSNTQQIFLDEQDYREELDEHSRFGSVSDCTQNFSDISNISSNQLNLYEFITSELQNISKSTNSEEKIGSFHKPTNSKGRSNLKAPNDGTHSSQKLGQKCDQKVNYSVCNRVSSQLRPRCLIIPTEGQRHEKYYVLQKLIKDNINQYPNIAFSFMGPNLRGSMSISNDKNRLSLLIIWSVQWLTSPLISPLFDVQALPFMNCSSHISSQDVIDMSRDVTKGIRLHLKQIMEHSNSSPIESFLELTNVIYFLQEDLKLQLETTLALYNDGYSKATAMPIINSALEHHNSYSMRTLDMYDFQAEIEKVEIGSIFKDHIGGTDVRSSELVQGIAFSNPMNNDTCFICFEKFDGEELVNLKCSHKTCKSCWRLLIQSSVSSGNTKIRCPAFRCSNHITLYDIAHTLFSDKNDNFNEEACHLMMKSLQFHAEQYCNKNTQLDVKHCCTPSCSRMCSFSSRFLDKNVVQMYSCDCGAMYCTLCKKMAHVGLTCEEYGHVRNEIDSGRFNAELKSLDWVKSNTKPCPKCKFPIQKIDGCNHVRCSKCMYYFCWQCGGPGEKCRAFFCDNTKRSYLTASVASDDSVSESASKIRAIINLTTAETLLEISRNRGRQNTSANKEKEELLGHNLFLNSLQSQLLQTLVWLHLNVCIRILNGNTKILRNSRISSSIKELELMFDASFIRDHKENIAKKKSLTNQILATKSLA